MTMNALTEPSLPLVMLIVFAAAKLCSEVFERLRLPGLVGEILSGILIGPCLLNWVHPSALLDELSELGVLFLLFRVGLETRASELLKVGGTATIVALLGVLAPLGLGFGIAQAWGYGFVESSFIGAALVATSVAITAGVLSAAGKLQETASQIILAAAVVDDVLGLIVLSLVSSAARGRLSAVDFAITATLPVIFLFVLARWGSRGVRRAVPLLEARLRASEGQFQLAVVLLFALSVLALYTGVAAIVGAFLAGMSLGESVGRRVHTLVHGTSELLVPFFLAGIGLRLELSVFRDPALLALAALLLVAAIVSKLAGCGAGAWRLGWRGAMKVGCGMVPRGEVGMVVAQLGLSMAVISKPVYAVIVFVALATTVIAPALLGLAWRESAPRPAAR